MLPIKRNVHWLKDNQIDISHKSTGVLPEMHFCFTGPSNHTWIDLYIDLNFLSNTLLDSQKQYFKPTITCSQTKKLIWTCREVSRVCSEYWCNAPRIQHKPRQTFQLSIGQDLESRQEGLQTRLVLLLLPPRKIMELGKRYQRHGQGKEGK